MKRLWNQIKLSAALCGRMKMSDKVISFALIVAMLVAMMPNVGMPEANAVVS